MDIMKHGKLVQVENPNGKILMQYQTRRDFPTDNKKYCYNLSTKERRRYLVRATFQYGSPENEDAYPKFQLYLDATEWATVTIQDASRIYVYEMIIRAPSDSIDVCICCAITGSPFISTLELRPLNLSMYATDFEDNFFLNVAARVNFGALNRDVVRYPDDPYDRIWESDLDKRQNFLVGVAPGTKRIKTSKDIDIRTREYPPVKVMQTAVVGTEGELSYRLNLEGFPANARAYAYFAEIEDLAPNETRKFRLGEPYIPDYSNAVVNIAENANGSCTLYEPSYMNVTLDFVLSFSFSKTNDSTEGPLLNAIEISKYQQIAPKTDRGDVTALNALRALSGQNVKGTIPPEFNHMEGLTELWLDSNSLTGPLPDMSTVNQKRLDWLARLQIAEDAAKGLEYLHTGCSPSIIHRDVKTSNILLDINMRAKVSDFGLSRQAEEDLTHVSSVARGTVGYLDPEYYASQQFTEKSDVYSFGVVLLELISGKKPVSVEDFGPELNIVHWARSLVRKGDVISIVDPFLVGNVKIESIWRIAEVAIQCVEQHGYSRPKMQEIILAIQDAMKIEKGDESNSKLASGSSSRGLSSRKTLLASFLEIESPDLSNGCLVPSAR
ncbi:hypothetical protein COLO4_23559 [Corchorus olitorius]|uniref:Protein kinase domain-containing protein n=1 Tax=Corchorus olitorius TaxID=93759 RepID=A0A1R3IG71_9ROSI|nr:hypothetical protein COLO4_23559 [Corchorus olitorius]